MNDIFSRRTKLKCELYKKRLRELKDLRRDNWVTDPTLAKWEKFFHSLTLVCGFCLLGLTSFLLFDVARRDIKGASSIVLIVVLMILIIFSFFCISGRGVEIVEKLKERIETAELIKLWGLTIKGFHKNE